MSLNAMQQKLAEKLIILNERTAGMLTRIYNIKKACADPKSKPPFLSDKNLEGALKIIAKKFPAVDARCGGSSLNSVQAIKQDVVKSLSLYYFTFSDLLELKDNICELLTIIDACQMHLDITLNYDVCMLYLSLVANYVSMLVVLSRVEDRKAVLGLYNVAAEMHSGHGDASFPRLGQLIVDYEQPLRQLGEDFTPHSRVLAAALSSVAPVFARRNLSAEQMRHAQLLSLVSAPQQLLYVAQTDTMPCEYLSLDAVERILVLCLSVCQPLLNQPVFAQMWQAALESNLCVRLFRDEVLMVHSTLQTLLEQLKGHNKRIAELKEYYATALHTSGQRHRERRKYLRSVLRQLCLLLADQPGLLGPKALFAFMALSFARDELLWLLRHADAWPVGNQPGRGGTHGKHRASLDDVTDRQLPELLFYMEELRALVVKYVPVIQRYYVQYVCGYDAVVLAEHMAHMELPEDENLILSAFCNTLAQLSLDTFDESQPPDFRGARLDWCRLQAYMSNAKSRCHLKDNRKFAYGMNAAVFHLKLIDYVDELLVETADLSLFAFYSKQVEECFQRCLELPSQTRYVCALPQLCTHFANALHALCPEERTHISEKSLSMCNIFLDEMAKEAKNIITNICDHHIALADKTTTAQTLPKHVPALISQVMRAQTGATLARSKSAKKQQQSQAQHFRAHMPGDESYRRNREDMDMLDKLHTALTELCYSINYYSQLVVWEHVFAPREYLTQHLENRFNKAVVGMAVLSDNERQEVAKPSELLNSVKTYMSVLQTVENYVQMDVGRIFSNVLLQQTQPQDCHGEDTVTALYTKWYLEVLLRRVATTHIVFLPHLKLFSAPSLWSGSGGGGGGPGDESQSSAGSAALHADQLSSLTELTALCELLGAAGIKWMRERLVWHVASQVSELKKVVAAGAEPLAQMRACFDRPDKMRELFRQFAASADGGQGKKGVDVVDNLLQRLIIIGEILCFEKLLREAMHSVMRQRVPFLLNSIDDLKNSFSDDSPEQLDAWELCASAGGRVPVDPALVAALRAQTCCLLLVVLAVCVPRLARSETAFYKATIGAHLNNAHCIPTAINALAGAMFTVHGRGDVAERCKEFLALASSTLLRMSHEPDRELLHNKESVYLLLDMVVSECPWLTVDLLESCFPYALLRSSYHYCYKLDQMGHAPHPQHR